MLRVQTGGPIKTRGSSSITVTQAGETLIVRLLRHPAARRFILRVRFAQRDAVLTIPARATLREARQFAERHGAWIAVRLRRLPTAIPFVPGSIVPLRGISHTLVHCPGERGMVWVERAGAIDGSSSPEGVDFLLCVAGRAEHFARRVRDYFKREARRDLENAVSRHTRALGLRPRKLGLRDTVSRWGSCSASGSLNFSWRLIMAPPFVLDYLAAHEVAHLAHLDHSNRFWVLTRTLCADTDRAEAWLSAHGRHLHKYGDK